MPIQHCAGCSWNTKVCHCPLAVSSHKVNEGTKESLRIIGGCGKRIRHLETTQIFRS